MDSKKENLIKVHTMLDRADHARLREVFGASIGVSKAIRIAIRRFLTDHEALTRRIIDNSASPRNME